MENCLGNDYHFSDLSEIPVSEDRPVRPFCNHHKDHSGIKTRMKILVVEDNILNLKLNCAILEKSLPDAVLLIARNGKECLKMFREERPDIILMDVRMPEMDGITATRKIREMNHSEVVIIGLSAEAREAWIHKGLSARMNEYLTKPLVDHALMAIVKKYF